MDKIKMDKEMTNAAKETFEGEQNKVEQSSSKNSKPRGSRLEMVERNLKLYCALAKKATNLSICRADGSVTENDDQKLEDLAKHWGNTFEERR